MDHSEFVPGFRLGCAVMALMTAAGGAMAQGPSFRTIAPDEGFEYALVQDVSADGTKVLVSLQTTQPGTSTLRGYILNLATNTRTELVDPFGRDLNPIALSADGSVVAGNLGGGALQGSVVFRWEAGQFLEVPGLPGGEINSVGGISADGSIIIGNTGTSTGNPYQQAWRWGEEGTVPLEDIGNDELLFCVAEGVSGNGLVAVGYGMLGDFNPDEGEDLQRGVIWNNSTVATDIGILPNPFNAGLSGYAASSDGSVVVGFGGATGPGGGFVNRGFRWTQATGLQDLGGLASQPAGSTHAMSCSSDGSIIAGYGIDGGVNSWNALVWRQQTGWRTLRSLLADRGVTYPANIVQRETFISGDGTVLAGWAYNTTTQRYVGYVATLPVGCGLADVAPAGGDGIVDGSDFVAFINSFSTGNIGVDAVADVAGAGPNGDQPDGIIDGSDFIAFINAFAVGC